MNLGTDSTKYPVVIPQKVGQALNIQPGQKIQVVDYGNPIVMIPVRPIEKARGSLSGIDTDPKREKKDRDLINRFAGCKNLNRKKNFNG